MAMLLPVRSEAQDKKLDSFTISFASVSGTRAPLWIAKDLGLFEKYGLDGNLVYIASGVTSVNALLGGSVDIIAASGSSAVGAAARGAPLVIIASLGHIAYKLITHPSITSIQGLRGKVIGSSRIGAGTDFALQRLLPKLGLTPGKDVTLLPTGISESDRRLLMLVQGKIDATLGTEDNLLQLAARGMKFNVLADVYEAGVYTTGSDIATSRALLKQKPRQLKAFSWRSPKARTSAGPRKKWRCGSTANISRSKIPKCSTRCIRIICSARFRRGRFPRKRRFRMTSRT